jgi:hypothetical protein
MGRVAHTNTAAKAPHSTRTPAPRISADCSRSERAGKGLSAGLLSWDFWGNFISICWYIVATELQ